MARELRGRVPNDSDERSVRRTLSLLNRDGLTFRLPYADLRKVYGTTSFAWGLTKKGVDAAGQYGFNTDATKPLTGHSARTLDHELEISYFHREMKALCAAQQWTFDWLQKEVETESAINPDATMGIEKAGGLYFPFFIEIDRARFGRYKDGEPQVVRQSKRYLEYYNSDECKKDYGWKQFRVIRIVPNEARRKYLLSALPEHRMFWVTTEELFRQDIGGEIFKTPKGDSFSFLAIN